MSRRVWVGLFCGVVFVSTFGTHVPVGAAEGRAADKPQSQDLQRVQGKWELVVAQDLKESGVRRAVKEIKGSRETVTFYGDEGKVLRAHTVDVKLTRHGDLHVFTYSNMEVIDGAEKGAKEAGPYSYVYRADDEAFYEVVGLFPGEEKQPVIVRQWKHVKG